MNVSSTSVDGTLYHTIAVSLGEKSSILALEGVYGEGFERTSFRVRYFTSCPFHQVRQRTDRLCDELGDATDLVVDFSNVGLPVARQLYPATIDVNSFSVIEGDRPEPVFDKDARYWTLSKPLAVSTIHAAWKLMRRLASPTTFGALVTSLNAFRDEAANKLITERDGPAIALAAAIHHSEGTINRHVLWSRMADVQIF